MQILIIGSAPGHTGLEQHILSYYVSSSMCNGFSLAGGLRENCVSPLIDDDADDGAV